MMKVLGIFLSALSLSAALLAQEKQSFSSLLAQKNILNHMDVGINVGTVGVGIDVAVPIGNYVRIRAGYNYMPRFTIKSDFPIETRNGSIEKYIGKINGVDIDKKIAEFGVDLNEPKFKEWKDMVDQFRDVELRDFVTMGLRPNLHQFKFLVDVLPFKNNKHWSFTTGFFVGPSIVGDACNLEKETMLLQGVSAYNQMYVKYCQEGIAENYYDKFDEFFYNNGVAGIPIGSFADGDKAIMVPAKDGTARAEMEISKIRPYIGLGYNTHLSRNRKWNLNVDAGVLFLCGKPRIYVDNVYKTQIGISNTTYNLSNLSSIDSGTHSVTVKVVGAGMIDSQGTSVTYIKPLATPSASLIASVLMIQNNDENTEFFRIVVDGTTTVDVNV